MMERVLVVFQATEARTESMALAFGLGAVEGGANIRLRHLAGAQPAALEHQGYGHIKNEDIEWAEVIGLAIETPEPAGELTAFLEQVRSCPKTAGKRAYIFGNSTRTPSIAFAERALEEAGFSLIGEGLASLSNDPQHLKIIGRKLAGFPQTS